MFDPIVNYMEIALRNRTRNHQTITSNLANSDTPGYTARRLEFENALRAMVPDANMPSLQRTAAGHLDLPERDPTPKVIEDKDNVAGNDGNNVSREAEMTRMAENQLLYRASAKAVSRHLALVRYAISEGGK